MTDPSAIVLDTHVWVWLMNGSPELTDSAALAFINRACRSSSLYVSAISVWEVAVLEAKNRIVLRQECSEWVAKALGAPGMSLAPLTPAIAVASSRLPGIFNGDPADRILVATTRTLQATLITRDKEILTYAAANHVQAIPA